MTLATDTRALLEAVNDLDRMNLEDDLEQNLTCLAMIRESRQTLAHIERELERKLADLMPGKRVVVSGVGTFERHKRTNRKSWDSDDLLRAVLDTRLVDEDGVIADETPLEKVLHVWNLGAPRVTALKARGIQADEFCHAEDAGTAIQLITS